MTDDEATCLEHLVRAWNAWVALPNRSPDDTRTFRDAIHHCQLLVGHRDLQRALPEIWLSTIPARLSGEDG